MNKKIGYLVAIVVIVAAAYFIYPMLVGGVAASTASYAVQLTDPPTVPSGTQSLIIDYSGVTLFSSNGIGRVSSSASGSVNLMSLSNFTQTIAVIQASANETFDAVSFNVTSADITINNVTYNVTVPSSRIYVRLNADVNSSAGGTLLDLSPTVIQVYTTENSSVFILVPAVKAIVVGKAEISGNALSVGSRTQLQASDRTELEAMTPSIEITGASLAQVGNMTEVSVTVKDTGNSSVTLKHVFVSGVIEAATNATLRDSLNYPYYGGSLENNSVSVNANASVGTNKSGANANASNRGSANVGTEHENSSFGTEAKAIVSDTHIFNVSNAIVRAKINAAINFSLHYFNVLNFVVSANGTLMLPFTEAEAEGPNGYVLQPGASVTLAYDAVATMGESHVTSLLVANQTYSIRVSGEEGSFATMNVTAT